MMGVFGATGRLAVRETLNLVGAHAILLGWRLTARSLRMVAAKNCPKCAMGRLYPFVEIDGDGVEHTALGCSRCDHFQAINVAEDRESLERLSGLAAQKLAELSGGDRARMSRKQLVLSRVFYAIALMIFAFAFYSVFALSGWSVLNAAGLGSYVFVQGMKSSYRHWQLESDALFQPGSFWKWIGQGSWLA
jgi:hypothetical protein